eukprot:gene7617-biopygen9090
MTIHECENRRARAVPARCREFYARVDLRVIDALINAAMGKSDAARRTAAAHIKRCTRRHSTEDSLAIGGGVLASVSSVGDDNVNPADALQLAANRADALGGSKTSHRRCPGDDTIGASASGRGGPSEETAPDPTREVHHPDEDPQRAEAGQHP